MQLNLRDYSATVPVCLRTCVVNLWAHGGVFLWPRSAEYAFPRRTSTLARSSSAWQQGGGWHGSHLIQMTIVGFENPSLAVATVRAEGWSAAFALSRGW
jgi:hypothetical protein